MIECIRMVIHTGVSQLTEFDVDSCLGTIKVVT